MKTTRSAFSGFPRDRYTTLPETDDRLMATRITAIWRYGAPGHRRRRDVRRGPRDACSRSSPTTTAHRSRPRSGSWPGRSSSVTRRSTRSGWSCPTCTTGWSTCRRSGSTNDREIYTPTTEPHGLIEATVRRGRGLTCPTSAGLPPGVELRRGDVPGAERILTHDALAFVADLQRRFGPVRLDLLAPARGAPGRARRGRPARLPDRDPRGPRGGLDGRPGTARPRRPARRDHRAGRAEDDDQRPQLGRPRVHGRPRGRPVADVGQRRRRPGRAAPTRSAARSTFDSPGGQGLPAGRRDRDARRPAARLAPGRVGDARRRRAGVGQPVRLRAVPVPQRGRDAAAGERAVPLPGQARVAPRGAALERGLHPRPGRARDPARLDPGDGPDRDDPRRVRDGRDPVRAARARRRAERRPLGLPVQRDQEAARRGRTWPSRIAPS